MVDVRDQRPASERINDDVKQAFGWFGAAAFLVVIALFPWFSRHDPRVAADKNVWKVEVAIAVLVVIALAIGVALFCAAYQTYRNERPVHEPDETAPDHADRLVQRRMQQESLRREELDQILARRSYPGQ